MAIRFHLPFLVLAATLMGTAFAGMPTVQPSLETRPVIDLDTEDASEGARLGDADDPAIWLHPTDSAKSLVAGALKEGGLEVYNLQGEVVQSVSPKGVRYNNVDVLYGFPLEAGPSDLFIFSDRFKDVLAVYAIDPGTGDLRDVSDSSGPLIFTAAGEEPDGETTAYGLATYYDAATKTFYAFVSRRETDEVAQLELVSKGNTVSWEKVRTITLPLPADFTGDNPQVEGMVVDPELGFVYLAQEQVGIWKVAADASSQDMPELIHPVDSEVLSADAEGLTLYFGPDGTGYLLASSQGSSTFLVYTREGDNSYLGSFVIGANGDIDAVDESDGSMVLNVPLGPSFPEGLLVVHDGLNEPEVLAEDDGELENVSTAFKFVAWQNVAEVFDPPLLIDTESYQPRP